MKHQWFWRCCCHWYIWSRHDFQILPISLVFFYFFFFFSWITASKKKFLTCWTEHIRITQMPTLKYVISQLLRRYEHNLMFVKWRQKQWNHLTQTNTKQMKREQKHTQIQKWKVSFFSTDCNKPKETFKLDWIFLIINSGKNLMNFNFLKSNIKKLKIKNDKIEISKFKRILFFWTKVIWESIFECISNDFHPTDLHVAQSIVVQSIRKLL